MGKSCKVVVCGQASVGKTSILEQLLYGNHVVGERGGRGGSLAGAARPLEARDPLSASLRRAEGPAVPPQAAGRTVLPAVPGPGPGPASPRLPRPPPWQAPR